MTPAVIGVDVGTSSSKGVVVDLDGLLLASSVVEHAVQRPGPGMVEMDGSVWWEEFVALSRRLLSEERADVRAVGVSGMGPCVLLTDAADELLRPAILYGVDTRSGRQIERLNDRSGAEEILRRCGSVLSSQAAGGQGRVGRRRGAAAVRPGAAAVHAELVPRAPADRRVRPGPSLRQPVHAALRLAGSDVA